MRWLWTILAVVLLLGCGPWEATCETARSDGTVELIYGRAFASFVNIPHRPVRLGVRLRYGLPVTPASAGWNVVLPYWIGSWGRPFAAGVPLYLPAAGAAALAFCSWRRHLRPRPGHCKCGYALAGNVSGVCPECGEAVS